MDAVASLDSDGGMTGRRHAVVGLPGLMRAALRLRSAFSGAKTCFLVPWGPFFLGRRSAAAGDALSAAPPPKTAVLGVLKRSFGSGHVAGSAENVTKKMSYSQSIDLDEP